MDLRHEFTVPAGVAQTWDAITDIASVAECFPGAVVTGVEGDSFEGSVKVKLGPIALVYNGAGHFVVKDEASRTMKIEAKGKDKRGNGTAGANVDLTMTEAGDGTTVLVVTDLAITGKPAQFGRGVIQDVSDKLLGQFVDCLRQRMSAPSEPEPAADSATGSTSTPDAGSPAGSESGSGAGAGTGASSGSGSGSGSASAASAASAPRAQTAASARPVADDSLDLGATVVPILLKTYGKQLAAGLGVLALLLWILRRRRP